MDEQKIKVKVKRVLEDLDCLEKELSILFTSDEYIAELNQRYRGKEGPTDVLAFPMQDPMQDVANGFPETAMLGDVAISVDTALRDADDLKEPLERTIDRLLIHGILHLLGYDHEKSSVDSMLMTKEEERLLNFFWM